MTPLQTKIMKLCVDLECALLDVTPATVHPRLRGEVSYDQTCKHMADLCAIGMLAHSRERGLEAQPHKVTPDGYAALGRKMPIWMEGAA